MKADQLLLDLPQRAAYGRSDFLVADSNRDAVNWIDRWPDWPVPVFCLYGPAGCGKSHLAHVWQARVDGRMITTTDLANEGPEALLADTALILDDLRVENLDEELLLHLYNLTLEKGGYLLITARQPIARWHYQLADLGSRLRAVPAAGMGIPDEDLFAAVLSKLFADRQVIVSGDVVAYLVNRIERSFAAAQAVVAHLDRMSMARARSITVPLAKQAMAELPVDNQNEEPKILD